METYYYKQIDELGKVIMLLTCDTHLESSEFQIEITEEEYNQLFSEIGVIENEELSDLPV